MPIEEHQKAEIEGSPGPEQSAEEKKTVKLVLDLFKKAKKHRKIYDKDWIELYQFFRGKQWKEKRPPYRHSEVLNFSHAAIQTILPILTDSRPNIDAIPEEPEDYAFSEVISQLLQSKWDANLWGQVVAEALVDSSIYGTAIGYVPWNPAAAKGLGDYEFQTIDPLYFYPDPNARDVNDEFGNYFIVAEPLDVSEVKRKYPHKKDSIKADVSDLENAKIAKADFGDVVIRNAIDGRTLVEGEKNLDTEAPDKVLLITAWIWPDEVIEEEFENQDGSKAFRTKKQYPNGRKVVIASNTVLEDRENPYMDGKAPYAKLVDHILPREFWGDGELSQLVSPQRMINKLISYVLDTLIIMGNPIWLVPNNAGVDTDNLINSPGLVVEHNPEGRPVRSEGVQLQPFVLQTLDRLQQLFEKISGISEVSQGVSPSANASGIQVELLQEAAQTKLRLKGRNLEAFLSKIGELMVSRIMQFYTVPRVFRITNNEAGSKYFKFHVEENEEGHRAFVTEFTKDDATDSFVQQPTREFPIKGGLDVKITTGTSLPFAKAQKAARSRELLELGIMDEEDYLHAIDWPGADKLIAKLRERKEAMAEAEAAAAAAGQPPVQQQG